MIGRELGKFRVIDELGKGGMGVVYLAEHTLLGKQVAVKVLRKELTADEVLVKRFFDEAKATSNIHHPGIIDVIDFGYAEDGVAYIAMELLRGETLRARIKRTVRIPEDQALRIVAQVASALQAAHDRGIVHRDLKPANLFLVPDPDIDGGERVRILDFGVAKLTGEDSVVTTASGAIIGTPVYMAPEQCSGAGNVDHRADLYSVGCILYEAVCGKRPFNAKGRGELIAMQMFDTPARPSTHVPVTAGVEQLILRLLEKDPAARFQSATALGRETRRLLGSDDVPSIMFAETDAGLMFEDTLHSAVSQPPISAPGSEPRSTTEAVESAPSRSAARMGIAAAAVLLALGGSAWWWTSRRGATDNRTKAATTMDAGTSATFDATPPRAQPPPEPPPTAGIRWIRVDPPPEGGDVILGVTAATAAPIPRTVSGLRPSRRVLAPRSGFYIQQHEVTWAALDPWLAEHAEHRVFRPQWLPTDAATRASLPATGVPWSVAYAYCRSIAGNLPSEEQWEYAARGQARRAYSWGSAQIDLSRARAYQGAKASVHPVTEYDQDRTPGPAADSVWGMMSNAREWTASLWREDEPGTDESWVQQKGAVYRAVRGLPLGTDQPDKLPREGAAYRDALCAAAGCIKGKEAGLQYVGFRCVRAATGR